MYSGMPMEVYVFSFITLYFSATIYKFGNKIKMHCVRIKESLEIMWVKYTPPQILRGI
jgi:hypothetical protein